MKSMMVLVVLMCCMSCAPEMPKAIAILKDVQDNPDNYKTLKIECFNAGKLMYSDALAKWFITAATKKTDVSAYDKCIIEEVK